MVNKFMDWIRKAPRFWLIWAVSVLSFLTIVGIGLLIFWDFIAAYEVSRPKNAIEAYMAGVDAAYISNLPKALPDGVDLSIQPEAEARMRIAQTIGEISYAKNTKLSTEEKAVYMVLSGGKPLGQVEMTVVRTDGFGLDYWAVTQEDYDFSNLLTEPLDITVPEDFTIRVGDMELGENYVTKKDVPFPTLEAYYEKYDLPALWVYTLGPVIGGVEVTVTDPTGNPVEITKDTNMRQFLGNCTEGEEAELEKFLEGFVQSYTDFTSVTGGQGKMQRNYNNLVKLMVSGGMLAQRMKEAMVGLIWVTDRNASVKELRVDMCLRLEEGRYLCDFTYVVDTNDFSGSVESVSHVEMVIVETAKGLRAESMVTK